MSAENPQQPHRPKQDGSELHYPCAGGSHSGTSSNQEQHKGCTRAQAEGFAMKVKAGAEP